MSLACKWFGHRPKSRPIWNDGAYFSTCDRCGKDILSNATAKKWRPPPPGHRVSWRPRTDADVRW